MTCYCPPTSFPYTPVSLYLTVPEAAVAGAAVAGAAVAGLSWQIKSSTSQEMCCDVNSQSTIFMDKALVLVMH